MANEFRRLQRRIRIGRWLPIWWWRRAVYLLTGNDPWRLFKVGEDKQ